MSEPMTINETHAYLSRIRDLLAESSKEMLSGPHDAKCFFHGTRQGRGAEACETAIRILAALSEEGCKDFDTVLDVLQDYRSLASQYQTMYLKYEHEDKPKHKNGVWLCPACSSRVQSNHSYCHRCGKRIGWS